MDTVTSLNKVNILEISNVRLHRFPGFSLARHCNVLRSLDLSGNALSDLRQVQALCLLPVLEEVGIEGDIESTL